MSLSRTRWAGRIKTFNTYTIMQQKTLTNKERLIQGGKVIAILIWAVATAWTFSTAMTHGAVADKVVAGILLAFNAYAIFRKMKKVWDEE